MIGRLTPTQTEMLSIRSAELTLAGEEDANKQLVILNKELADRKIDMVLDLRQIYYFRTKEVYKRMIKEHTESLVKEALIELKKNTSKLVPKIVKAIEKALDKNSMQAVPHALKILGIDSEEPTRQAQQLTVVLPGATAPVDVTNSSLKGEDSEIK